jgi:predicted MFS family arabinose efflux permease
VAGVIGNFVAGAVVSRTNAVRALRVVLLVGIVVLTGALTLLLTPVTAALAMALLAIWGLTYSALPVILQTFVFRLMPHAKDAATSLYVMTFNLSIAGGALLGAIAIDVSGVTVPIIVGAIACGIGGLATLLVRR